MSVQENVHLIRSHIQNPTVALVAVTKGQPIEKIREAIAAGQRDFGENYAQEMMEHISQLSAISRQLSADRQQLHWHFIGHLQRNKVRLIIDKVHLIHSVDSLDLAHEIDRRAASLGKIQPILIEVNLGGEETKTGLAPNKVFGLIREISTMKNLQLKGLMTLPPFFDDAEKARPYFRQLREIRDAINQKNLYKEPLTELSMGMTHDFEVAIEEGATIVRVGTGIFGKRL